MENNFTERLAQGRNVRGFSPTSNDFTNCSPIAGTRELRGPRIAVIDGPCDLATLSRIMWRLPMAVAGRYDLRCRTDACRHGTFVEGLLGAREDASIPGLCPRCEFLHIPLFTDEPDAEAELTGLADSIVAGVAAGARIINLSLAILNDVGEHHPDLAEALDQAESAGAIIVAAAGNQGRLAMGQIISHSVTIPVVALDASGRLLPDCNFGPAISERGVAARGYDVNGYAPGGGIIKMSGTSVATAIATGTLARAWMDRPDVDGLQIRAALARLGPRVGYVPPLLERDRLLAALDASFPRAPNPWAFVRRDSREPFAKLQGDTTMNEDNEQRRGFARNVGPTMNPGPMVAPAQRAGGCACGGAPGTCTCGDEPKWPNCANAGSAGPNFVYVLGTVDVCAPDQSIADELQRIADSIDIKQGEGAEGHKTTADVLLPVKFVITGETDEDVKAVETHEIPVECQIDPREDFRSWVYRILTHPQGSKARYIARQLKWILRVEGLPAYYICLIGQTDLDDLIKCLKEPKPRLETQKLTSKNLRRDLAHAKYKSEVLPTWPHFDPHLTVEAKETYPCIVEGDELCLREGHDLCLFVGTSTLVPIESCPGVVAPVLGADYFYAFTYGDIAGWLDGWLVKRKKQWAEKGREPKKEKDPCCLGRFVPDLPESGELVKILMNRLVQSADNYGDTDEWRALNYLAVQYKNLYYHYGDMVYYGYSLESIRVVRSRLWGTRRIVDPVFTFRNQLGGIKKYFVRVDVTHLFPTILHPLSEYFDR